MPGIKHGERSSVLPAGVFHAPRTAGWRGPVRHKEKRIGSTSGLAPGTFQTIGFAFQLAYFAFCNAWRAI